MSSNSLLHSEFIVELCKTCLTNDKILSLCCKELKFQYLENEPQKNVFKFLYDTYEVVKTIPTIGVIGQQFVEDKDTIDFLKKVKGAAKIDNDQLLVDQLCDHIKKIKFKALIEDAVDLFNKQQRDRSYELLQKKAEEIVNYNFSKKIWGTVFEDYEDRNLERERRAKNAEDSLDSMEKIPFGIHQIDSNTAGGMKRGTASLWMARSGGGKSTVLRWMGIHNARIGHRVVHFQLEGTEEDCYDLYDSAWTGILTEDISLGNIKESSKQKIQKTRRDILVKGGEIYVYAAETFNSLALEDAREILLDLQTEFGQIDLVIFDYMELCEVRGSFSGESGERRRRKKVGDGMVNIAAEFKCAVATATQANDISPKDYNNPDFRLTRHNLSEFKGALQPFAYFFTINQTDTNKDDGVAIIYEDKYRHHKAGKSIIVAQALDKGRFYDSKKTISEFLHEEY